jgi:hypothetical protein
LKITQKYASAKKCPTQRVAVTHAHKCKYDKQIFQKGMMIKEQRKLKGIKGINKREKMKQLASYCLKPLKNGLTQDVVEVICYIHLKHHTIKVDIQSKLNTTDHYLTTTLNFHVELMW